MKIRRNLWRMIESKTKGKGGGRDKVKRHWRAEGRRCIDATSHSTALPKSFHNNVNVHVY
jgi:hypothetical protein